MDHYLKLLEFSYFKIELLGISFNRGAHENIN